MNPGKLFAAVAIASALSVRAVVFNFDLTGPGGPGLTPGSEIPPNATSASGFEQAPITYDDTTHQMTINIRFDNLSGTFTAAHIHGPATTIQNASILYDLGSFVSTFNAGTSGFIESPPISGPALTLTDNPNGSGFTIADQESQLLSGLWYINVHDTAFPGGEIRGQLTPVPEPQSYAFAAGVVLLGFALTRRSFKSQPIA